MNDYHKKAEAVLQQVNQVILGKEQETAEIFLAFLADGHVLLEDIPGIGKTTMALSFTRSMDMECRRVQFTPDVLPSDLTGFSLYKREEEAFVFQLGSVFCNLLLADEINRTSPKTQSALLEVMEERQVSVDGVTRPVPRPFLVIATQNPVDLAGTQPLPQAQTDRFMISLSLGYPDFENELQMVMETGAGSRAGQLSPVISREDFLAMQEQIHSVYLKQEVAEYLLRLIRETRSHPLVNSGASPRAAGALAKMAKASAWFQGRDYVSPQDVAVQFPFVVRHRLILSLEARRKQAGADAVVEEILRKIKPPHPGVLHRFIKFLEEGSA